MELAVKQKFKTHQALLDEVVKLIIRWGKEPERKDLSEINEASNEGSFDRGD